APPLRTPASGSPIRSFSAAPCAAPSPTSTPSRWPAGSRTSPAGRGRGSTRRGPARWGGRCSATASAASGWGRRDAPPARRQPRLLHLQRLPPAGGGLGGGAGRRQQRRGQLSGPVALAVRRLVPLP